MVLLFHPFYLKSFHSSNIDCSNNYQENNTSDHNVSEKGIFSFTARLDITVMDDWA